MFIIKLVIIVKDADEDAELRSASIHQHRIPLLVFCSRCYLHANSSTSLFMYFSVIQCELL